MKKLVISITLLFLISCGIGLYYRQFYTNINLNDPKELNKLEVSFNLDHSFFEVAPEGIGNNSTIMEYEDKDGNVIRTEIDEEQGGTSFGDSEDDTISQADALRKQLDDADYIVIARAEGDIRLLCHTIQQPLYVEDVIRGEEALTQSTIFMQEQVERVQIETRLTGGYVNLMKKGEMYLVFLNKINDILTEEQNLYYCVEPIGYFKLGESENTIVGNDVVRYEKVADNEFFAADEEALGLILELKEEILQKYLEG